MGILDPWVSIKSHNKVEILSLPTYCCNHNFFSLKPPSDLLSCCFLTRRPQRWTLRLRGTSKPPSKRFVLETENKEWGNDWSLSKVCRNRTCVIVAHRLSTVVNADQVKKKSMMMFISSFIFSDCGDGKRTSGRDGKPQGAGGGKVPQTLHTPPWRAHKIILNLYCPNYKQQLHWISM